MRKPHLLILDLGVAAAILFTLALLWLGALELLDLSQVILFMDIFSAVVLIFVLLGIRVAVNK